MHPLEAGSHAVHVQNNGTVPSDVPCTKLKCIGTPAHTPQQPLATSWLSPSTQVVAGDQQLQA